MTGHRPHSLHYILGKTTMKSRNGRHVVQQIRKGTPGDADSLCYITASSPDCTTYRHPYSVQAA
ncbi:MAG: hypothetical protein SPL17_00485 [Bacteroidales bacterium]|nr:hypothetical protein [Bacteroidales bacterium]